MTTFEPELDELMALCVDAGRLSFTDLESAETINTPPTHFWQ